jgi:hypothetical protein
MMLAPLDEEAPVKVSVSAKAKPAASPAPGQPGSVKTEVKSARPQRSLIEEEFDAAQKAAPPQLKAAMRREGEFDPLKPPGYSGPSYGTPGWVFVAIGFGVIAVIGVVLALVFGVV